MSGKETVASASATQVRELRALNGAYYAMPVPRSSTIRSLRRNVGSLTSPRAIRRLALLLVKHRIDSAVAPPGLLPWPLCPVPAGVLSSTGLLPQKVSGPFV